MPSLAAGMVMYAVKLLRLRGFTVDLRLIRGPIHSPVGCALPVLSLTRAKSTILTSSHVRPPSLDHDSSKWGELDAICDQIYRFSSDLPFSVSCTKNSPRPFLNSPTFGSPTLPSFLLAK